MGLIADVGGAGWYGGAAGARRGRGVCRVKTIRDIIRARDRVREARAAVLAASALRMLRAADYPAWLVGSLARGEFRSHSNIDILIDASGADRDRAIDLCLRALGEHPSSIVFRGDLPPHVLPHFLEEAADGPRVRAS